ncbi:hypothetical protein H0H87_002655 [Tephrocybe sp. NHM501043]|nr:hypothetical protein H0H87_002655 [Tephrocybe sp. NHM501043]
MSYGNNDNIDSYNTGSTGLGDSKIGSQRRQGQGQGLSDIDSDLSSQQYGQNQPGNRGGANWSSSNTDDQFDSSGRTGRDNFGSSGSDSYGSNTGLGGASSGLGSSDYDDRNQGIGGQQGISSHQGQHKATMGDKMRGMSLPPSIILYFSFRVGGVEKGIGKVSGNPDLVERGQERSVSMLLTTSHPHIINLHISDWPVQ